MAPSDRFSCERSKTFNLLTLRNSWCRVLMSGDFKGNFRLVVSKSVLVSSETHLGKLCLVSGCSAAKPSGQECSSFWFLAVARQARRSVRHDSTRLKASDEQSLFRLRSTRLQPVNTKQHKLQASRYSMRVQSSRAAPPCNPSQTPARSDVIKRKAVITTDSCVWHSKAPT